MDVIQRGNMFRLAIFLMTVAASAQDNPASRAAREWRSSHEREIVDEFFELLAIPNVASDRANIRKNADLILKILGKRGVSAQLLQVADANPAVYGEIRTPGATRTILFYAHYDGQPLDPKEWATPPFQPVLRGKSLEEGGRVIELPARGSAFDPESRIYARSASDDKAPIITITSALDALRSAKIPLKSNIQFVFEGEEEAGSTNFERILEAHRELLQADVWLICDGPVHQSRRQQIVFGARGITSFEITIYGPKRELHSGHYGNWAPNPAMMLARLLASMKDDRGRILISGYYDDVEPLGAAEKKALAEAPEYDAELMRELWIGGSEGGGQKLVELITMPSLNVRGMASSRVGTQASNVIPTTAVATVDLRLVKGMNPQRAIDKVKAHIRKQGYFVVDSDPTPEIRTAHPRLVKFLARDKGYNAVRTPMDLPIAREVIRTVESARGPSVKLPTSGGSVPLDMIERVLKTHTISIPIANHDNNQHSYNENIRIRNLWDGIELMAALLAM